jgi:hypothetical protein
MNISEQAKDSSDKDTPNIKVLKNEGAEIHWFDETAVVYYSVKFELLCLNFNKVIAIFFVITASA